MLRFPDPTFKVKLGEWLGEVHSAVSSISFGGVFSQTLGTKPMPIGFFLLFSKLQKLPIVFYKVNHLTPFTVFVLVTILRTMGAEYPAAAPIFYDCASCRRCDCATGAYDRTSYLSITGESPVAQGTE